ncbi:MAG TPA: OadG family transporter subunit [Spirochaetota bacterium]|jgi:sodium pump decarboxylase gamma subunit|nr:MAG: oxaloacetate decarboxylase subunit gamma [Spirochaetes bacterium ADurb.Bin133]HNZ27642.1 OadG family transporter subunit [Spirochaetota bacterium]HPY86709.1 OadG family transporter subunit [Spirochaetota bacterium]HQB61413.1 OadG family transporter subunit [Spirochaetota bacterium]
MSNLSQLIGEAAIVMITGISVVFSFLITLVILVTLVGKIIKISGADKIKADKATIKEKDEKEIIAAIAMAMKKRL